MIPEFRQRSSLSAVRMAITCAFVAPLLGCAPKAAPDGWSEVTVSTDADFSGCWFTDSLNGWVSGGGLEVEGGILGRTRDGGRTWRFTSGMVPDARPGDGLHRIQFADSLRGWAAADGGHALSTTDGGQSWAVANPYFSGGRMLKDVRVSGASLWCAGPERVIASADGGESWSLLLESGPENGHCLTNALAFPDARHGWLATHGHGLLRTLDGGAHWESVTLPLPGTPLAPLRDVYFVDPEHGWAVGDNGVILHTDDGAGWRQQLDGVPVVRLGPDGKPAVVHDVVPELDTPAEPLTLTCVRFADRQRGWTVGYYRDAAESLVLGTIDGGEHWQVEYRVPGEHLSTLFVLDARHAWAAGDRVRTDPQVILRFGRPTR
ncbi:MAG: YCF48-related protein [Candidatus Eisenbacteria bacterium]